MQYTWLENTISLLFLGHCLSPHSTTFYPLGTDPVDSETKATQAGNEVTAI